jgi:hypothetical protein
VVAAIKNVGQFVDALRTNIVYVLAYRGLCGTVRMTMLPFWNLILFHEIFPYMMVRQPLTFRRVSTLLNKYMLQYMLVMWKCSQ